jgi:hypothetical protein
MILSSHGILQSLQSGAIPFIGLLDTYPGAGAAYSLRQLSSTYSGDAIRVRRSSDLAEQDIGFVDNELDTSALTTFCSGTNGFVTTWYDQSGNGRDATQTTAANQPQIVNSGSVNTYQSKNAILFDGVNTFLSISSITLTERVSLITAHENGTQTGGSLHKCTFASNSDAFKFGSIGYGIGKRREGSNGGTFGIANLDLTEQSISVAYAKTNTSELLFGIANNGSAELFKNNTSIGTDTYTPRTTGFDTNYSIGTNRNFSRRLYTGNIYEIVAYNSEQSSNRIGISNNINDYYSIY